ncbi:hypothetical protein RB195_019856 [Necator americanus]|uniref:Transmembrane protein n=1 Tax=Necator americanus TaxID=51031 RepID=A0ABR1CG26_NECAM
MSLLSTFHLFVLFAPFPSYTSLNYTRSTNSKPQEMKWSFILFFVALICAGVFEAAAAGDKKGSINRPWMGGFPTDSPQ